MAQQPPEKELGLLLGAGFPSRELTGHTDSTNTAAHNQKLSERRAEAVRAYLVSQGVAVAQLSARGYVEASPIADNSTPAGRTTNRRVELHKLS